MNKGKQGEGQIAVLFGKIQQVEKNFEFTKPTFTNAPDNGLDFELFASHNMGEKVDAIINDKDNIPVSSKEQIKIRVDHKNYNRKIPKSVVEKFVNDCEKNPNDAEHWLTGGEGLTSGAKKCMEEAQEVVRYYSQENLDKVECYYDAQLLAMHLLDCSSHEKEKVAIERLKQNERT